jgi:hypothetical protein
VNNEVPEVVRIEYVLGPELPKRADRRDLYECARTDCEHWAEVHAVTGCAKCACRLSREAVIDEVERLWPSGITGNALARSDSPPGNDRQCHS